MMAQGTVIQAYGRSFAGIIDMNMEQYYQVYDDFAEEPFKITGVSPFSIMGEPDPDMLKYADASARTNTRVKADVRKNFGRICEKAYCDWFVFDNSPATIWLALINGRYYSRAKENTDFDNECLSKAKVIYPLKEGFSENLRRQYDMFIDKVLEHYDAEHIILIRSHVPRFYSDGGTIKTTIHKEETRALLAELDDYFAEKAGCFVLDTAARFFENEKTFDGRMFSKGQEDLRIALETDIISVIEKRFDRILCYNKKVCGIRVPETPYSVEDYFRYSEYTFDDVSALFWARKRAEGCYVYETCAEAVLSNRDAAPYLYTKALFERNLRVLRDYEYCFIDLNGLTFEDRVVVRFDAKRFFEISSSGLRAIDLSEGRNVAYERNLAASENGLLPAESLVKLEWDFKRFVENEYTCDLSNIDDALESFETYLERGERKCLIPFVLRLNDFKEFEDSLYYIDYEDVLSNEHYVLELKDAPRRDFVYKPKVDMSFVFDPQARIAVVQCGLADQCFTTTEIRMLCDKYRLELYLEDLSYDVGLANHFMRLPLLQLTDNKISNRLFSTILSRKLRLRNKHCTKTIYQMFIYNWKNYGLKQLSAITNIDGMLNLPYAENELARNGIQLVRCDYSMDSGVSEYLGPAVYHIFAMDHQKIGYNSEVYKLKESFESYLRFPKIEQEDTQNTCLFEKMSKTDTVIVHVRRGDHVIGVWSQKKYSSNSVFKPTLERVYNSEEFAQYKNKLLVVLSDDIEFCKKHYGELGFGVAGENIIFVDWNHHYDSFRDMQIIAQGKVVIKFNGGFARCAALISKITEYVIHADDDGGKIEYQRNTESALKEL